jgi:hypothetical protein
MLPSGRLLLAYLPIPSSGGAPGQHRRHVLKDFGLPGLRWGARRRLDEGLGHRRIGWFGTEVCVEW